MNNRTIKNLISISIGLILIINLVLFLPILIFKSSQEQELKQTLNLESLEIVNYNPMNPTFRQYIKLDDPAYWLIDKEYQRTGLFSFQARQSIDSFENIIRVEGESLEEAKENFKKQEDGELTDYQRRRKEGIAEREKPIECQRLLDFPNVGTEIEDFGFLKTEDSFNIYWDNIGIRGYMYDENDVAKFQVRIDDSANKEIIKLVLNTEETPVENRSTKIQGIELITQDCQIIEVPTDPDGTFDFESALEEVGK